MVTFDTSIEDGRKIQAICDRAFNAMQLRYASKLDMVMDITAVHANGCPLNLDKFLAADDFNFYHDIIGIHNCLDRKTRQLRKGFLPRSSRPENFQGR